MKLLRRFCFVIILLFLGFSSVKAADCNCYEVKDTKYNSVNYVATTPDLANQYDKNRFKVSKVDNSKCKGQVAKCNSNTNKNNSNSSSSYGNYDENGLVNCGGANGKYLLTDIPKAIPKTVHIIYLIIQILVPILLVVFGSIDFLKAVIGQKDDEIKKGQQTFVKRLIYGALVFFVFAIVRFVVSFAADDSRILNCASCLLNNDKSCVSGG